MIWGMTINPGEDWTIEAFCDEHLTMATLECRPGKNDGEDNPCSYLLLKMPTWEHVICTLQKGLVLQQNLNMVIKSGSSVTFTVQGTGTIYLTGHNKKSNPGYAGSSTMEEQSQEKSEEKVYETSEVDKVEYGNDEDPAHVKVKITEERTNGTISESRSGHTKLRCTTRMIEEEQSQEKSEEKVTSEVDKVEYGDDEDPAHVNVKITEERTNGTISESRSGHTKLRCTTRMIEGSPKRMEEEEVEKEVDDDDDGEDEGCENRYDEEDEEGYKDQEDGGSNSQNPAEEPQGSKKRKFDESKEEPEESICCSKSPKPYKSKRSLQLHLEKVHVRLPREDGTVPGYNFVCEACSNIVLESNREMHKMSHAIENVECSKCKKIFVSAWSLHRHLKAHSLEERCFKCNVCGSRHAQESELSRHKLRKHGMIKQFHCDSCRNKYWTQMELDMHRQHHTIDLPITCPLCDRQYKDYLEMKIHMVSHAPENPFLCRVCQERFPDCQDLHNHQERHMVAVERPFRCGFCEREYKHKHDVKYHEIAHIGGETFHCRVCGRAFYKNSKREMHEKTHRTAWKTTCCVCDLVFYYTIRLERHEKSHKDIPCKKCSKVCKTGLHLRKHIDNVHRTDEAAAGPKETEEKVELGSRFKDSKKK